MKKIRKKLKNQEHQIFQSFFEERKSSITFNEFSQLEPNFNEKKLEINNFTKLLKKVTENSFEIFKPKLSNEIQQANRPKKTKNNNVAANSDSNRMKNKFGSEIFSSSKIILNSYKSLENKNNINSAFEVKFLIKSNKGNNHTDRVYDKKNMRNRKTIDLNINSNKNSNLTPQSPLFHINSDREPSRSLTNEVKISLENKNFEKKNSSSSNTSVKILKNSTGNSLHKKERSQAIMHKKNKAILEKKSTNSNNNHLRYFSLNGMDSSGTSKLLHASSTFREKIGSSPHKLANLKAGINLMSFNQKKIVKNHLEQFLTNGTGPIRCSSGNTKNKNKNLELIQGTNTQNLFKKIYQKK